MRRSDAVVADVMAKIARKELTESSRLPTEAEMADAYGVGRSTIREAVQTLSAKGLLIARQGSGTVVAPEDQWSSLDPEFLEVVLGDDRFAFLIEARMVIEPSIARLAGQRVTEEEIENLRQICAKHEHIDIEDRAQHAQIDIEFHTALAAASHNPILESMHASMAGLGRELRFASAEIEGAVERAILWHQQVLEAVANQDPSSAESAMKLHMRQVQQEFHRLESRSVQGSDDRVADPSG